MSEQTPVDGAGYELATLAGGCFWCLEAVFLQLRGVESVTSGYSGGTLANPTYEQVCTGRTGHAEVVQIRFDPETIPYKDLLHIFFSIHDPTTLNRQGGDVGTQYRSAIFYHTQEQKSTAQEVIAELGESGIWNDPIVTEISEMEAFYPAEAYHDNYYQRNQSQPYCQVVISPKLSKFRKKYSTKLKS
ncbi:MAG: peptide-methionine (S)-S-oxide reductase MsrA [Candidatus Promineifilaceae bacterium]|jgi:peptide-methionine (S)-S-oxide reductase